MLASVVAFMLVGATPVATQSNSIEGMRDIMLCVPVTREDVTVVPHGFYIRSLNEFVHYDHTLPSARGGFWLCKRGGDLKFFAPQSAL